MIRSGVDIVEIHRIRSAVEKYGDRFLKRIYTDREISVTNYDIASLAGRFAAKEAVAKVLGTGIGVINWVDIEIIKQETGAPLLQLHGYALVVERQLSLNTWTISLSHTRDIAIAIAFAM